MSDIQSYPGSKMVTLSSLRPYGNNSRTHSQSQINQIVASIREFGFTNPILIADDMTIVAGHGRFLAAEVLGLDKVPCVKLSGLSETKRRAYVIADNKLAEQAGWDKELLSLELGSLDRSDFNLEVLGFSEKELAKLLQVETDEGDVVPATDPDELAVIATCANAEEQQAAYDLLAANGYTCRTASLKGVVERG
ncbi:ParB/Srx family N-terminal domain-containing protein [uncultured Ruegeria sp.]|uniref:ParB/Srx family N-terminal domain-containing protein n=2 Tax=uncultured Ruegeria sp. TaxID=259304 RepID=UPI002613EB46|nr:ParB/Srx family N-terminal domain-containing protein [uncultured Ruegeria sp.]